MSKTSDGTRDQPQFAAITNSPTFAEDLTLISDYFAIRSIRQFATVAAMLASSGSAADEVAGATNAPGCLFKFNGTTWDMIGVARFADSSARSTAMASPEAGWRSRLSTDLFDRRYNGSTWAPNGAGSFLLSHAAFSGNSLTTDGLFSADFLNYDVTVELESTSAATGISAIMRSSATDYTTGNHVNRRNEQNAITPTLSNGTTETAMTVGRGDGTGGGSARFTLYAPFAAQYTKYTGLGHDKTVSSIRWGNIPNTNSFTGMKIKLDGAVTGVGFVTVHGLAM